MSVALPELVVPGGPLSPADRERWARHLSLPGFGELAQRRLRAARVAVVGAGGLGSPVLAYLAAAGVGELVIIDDDVVEESNLQRQVLHGAPDVGRAKVDSAADSLARSAPWTLVRRTTERLTPERADLLLAGVHLVVDGSDNFATRYAVADACDRAGVPEVFGSLLGFDAQVGAFWPGHGPTYRDLFPLPPSAGSVASCAEAGVLGALCGVVGSMMALEAIKLLSSTGKPLLGRLLVLDALTARWREVPVRVRPGGEDSPRDRPVPHETQSLPTDLLLTPRDLAGTLERGLPVQLVDVRSDAERAVSVLPGALSVPLDALLAPGFALPPPAPEAAVVVYCRSGARSALAVRALREAGHPSAVSLAGGLLAWAADLDPSFPVG